MSLLRPQHMSRRWHFFAIILLLQVLPVSVLTASAEYEQTGKNVKEVYTTLQFNNEEVSLAFKKIEEATGFSFSYNHSDVVQKKINGYYQNQSLFDILLDFSRQSQLQFRQHNDVINVKPKIQGEKTKDVEVTHAALVVTGTVADQQGGGGLPGVNVLVKGGSVGTVTDVEGKYTINVPNDDDVLVFSSIGYATQEVPVNGRTVINVNLTEDVQSLDEIVVVGYGSQKKTNLTGAVSSVNFEREEMSSRPLTNVSSALTGLSSGMFVSQGDGTPGGDGATLKVRGTGSLNAGQNPLVIIDGQPGDINALNPNDVATVSILKDAASAAIYGSRASNGVILITTKTGSNSEGDITFNYTGNTGFSEPTQLFDIISNTADHMGLINQIQENSGLTPSFSQDRIDEWRQKSMTDPVLYPNTDWWDAVIKPNVIQNHTISARGGSEKLNFYSSLGLLNNNGVIDNTGYKRFTFKNNLAYQINDWLKLGTNLTALFGNADPASTDDIFRYFEGTTPGLLPKHPDGRYGGSMTGGGELQSNNVLRTIETAVGEKNTQNYVGKLFATLSPIEGLDITGSFFIDMYNYNDWSSSRPESLWDFQNETIVISTEGARLGLSNSYRKRKRQIYDLYATYDKTIENHHFRFLLGYNQEYYREDYFNAFKRDLISLNVPVLDAAPNDPQAGGNTFDYGIRSYFGRINYDFKGKYLFEANVRTDGSSRFSPDNRWGIFPSFSAGWILSEESFWAGLGGTLDYFKLRASWGQLGNNGIGNYAWQSVYNPANHSFNGQIVQGLAPSAIANDDITWETTDVLNIGADINLLQNLSFTFEYYNKFTHGILAGIPIPYVNGGLTPPQVNSAEVRNAGFESEINYDTQIGDVRLSVGVNGSFNKNTIESYKDDYLEPHGQGVWTEGKPIGIFWVREVDHIIQDQSEIDNLLSEGWEFKPSTPGPGDFLYKDQDGNKIIDDDDRILKGHSIPSFTYGGTINMGYKGFDLFMLFNGVSGWDKYLSTHFFGTQLRVDGYLYRANYLDAWTPENRSTTVPKLYTNDSKNDQQSDYFLYSANYLRLKSLQLGYTIPATLVNSIGIDHLRLYVNLENYFTFTSYPGMDPETDGSQYNGSITYPLMKTVSLGLNLSL
ncbi:MAG: TonB-dependent receptor [Cyclobacteriaceae bacterium]